MTDLAPGTIVRIPFGLDDTVEAEVAYVYGPVGREHVLVWLSPEISGEIVAQRVTQTVPLDAVRSVTAA